MRFIIVFWLLVSRAVADDGNTLNGQAWLEKANKAMKTLTYHGTVVFLKNGQLDTMKYQHGFEDGVEFERLSSLNSPLREVMRRANEISCLYKETSQKIEGNQTMDRSFIVNLPTETRAIDNQYLLAVAARESVAMRPAQIIAVLPKDELRYARKIWLDSESFLPLKVEVYGVEGNTLEHVMFTDLNVDVIGDAAKTDASQAKPQSEDHRHPHSATIDFENSSFQLKNWPAGFEKVFFIRKAMQKSQKTVDHLLISDGFSNISVYFEAKSPHSIEGLRNVGSVNSFSRVVGDWQITVLGEVPVKTVEYVAAGVSLR